MTLQHATHSLLAAPRALGSRSVTSRSSSVDSESSALGLYGSGSTAVGASAFQIAGYRTVELLPTAQQRQTLQKVRALLNAIMSVRRLVVIVYNMVIFFSAEYIYIYIYGMWNAVGDQKHALRKAV